MTGLARHLLALLTSSIVHSPLLLLLTNQFSTRSQMNVHNVHEMYRCIYKPIPLTFKCSLRTYDKRSHSISYFRPEEKQAAGKPGKRGNA